MPTTNDSLRQALKEVQLICYPERHTCHLNDEDLDKLMPVILKFLIPKQGDLVKKGDT